MKYITLNKILSILMIVSISKERNVTIDSSKETNSSENVFSSFQEALNSLSLLSDVLNTITLFNNISIENSVLFDLNLTIT